MDSVQNKNRGLLRLGGIAGICAGLCIITFALSSEIKGILFVPGALSGDSIEQWMQNVISNPTFVKFAFILPIIGFSSMLVVGMVLYQIVLENSWQKTLSMAGYVIGVPVVVYTFVVQLSLENQIVLHASQLSETGFFLESYTSYVFHRWMVVNDFIGTFFIIIIGHSFMSWSSYQAGILPKWMTYWALLNAGLLLLSFLYPLFPALRIASMAAPLSMIWLIVLGVVLLRKSRSIELGSD
jgi:hypothetical protein